MACNATETFPFRTRSKKRLLTVNMHHSQPLYMHPVSLIRYGVSSVHQTNLVHGPWHMAHGTSAGAHGTHCGSPKADRWPKKSIPCHVRRFGADPLQPSTQATNDNAMTGMPCVSHPQRRLGGMFFLSCPPLQADMLQAPGHSGRQCYVSISCCCWCFPLGPLGGGSGYLTEMSDRA